MGCGVTTWNGGVTAYEKSTHSDISQPFHQRCSELAIEGRSGILTQLLLKTVLRCCTGVVLAAELGGDP